MTRYYSSVAKPVLTPLALAIALVPAPGWAENYFNWRFCLTTRLRWPTYRPFPVMPGGGDVSR